MQDLALCQFIRAAVMSRPVQILLRGVGSHYSLNRFIIIIMFVFIVIIRIHIFQVGETVLELRKV